MNKLKSITKTDVLETADTLKSCVDEKLTAEDEQDALSTLVGQTVCECACGACVGVGVSGACSGHWEVWGSYPLYPGPSLGTKRSS